jgi:hypothetical protein
MAYNTKYTFNCTGTTQDGFGVLSSTRKFSGILDCAIFRPNASPVIANCSAMFILKRGSTAGDILTKSSSACASQKSYYPKAPVIRSSGLATSGLTGGVYLSGDAISLTMVASSSDCASLGMYVDVIVRGGDEGY